MKRNNYRQNRNSNSGTKSGDKNFKGKRNPKRNFEAKEDLGERRNDASWYTVPGQLAKDVASFSFNNATGVPVDLNYSFISGDHRFSIPGAMVLNVAPIPGVSLGASSAVTIAAKNFFTGIRRANSGSTNYTNEDLMMYILAMDSAYAYYAWMVRIYGVLRVYDQRNRYLGEKLAALCGGDVTDLMANMANFRAYINQYALKLGAFNVPANISLIRRHMLLFSNVFSDENNMKGQFYIYQPAYLYKYDEYNGAGRLVPQSLGVVKDASADNFTTLKSANPRNLNAIMLFGNNLINALAGSQDINTMSGDILKAYDASGVFKLDLIGEEFALAPVYSETVLMQIHNTTFVGNSVYDPAPADNSFWNTFIVKQDTNIGAGAILVRPLVRYGNMYDKFLDFWKSDVTPEDVMEATRTMCFTYDYISDTGVPTQGVETCGTEIPLFADVYWLSNSGALSHLALYTGLETQNVSVKVFMRLSVFNEHPIMYLRNSDTDTAIVFPMGETSNYTIVDYSEVSKIHDSALLSLLSVPLLGNVLVST